MKVLLINPREKGNINTRLPESLNRAQGAYQPLGISYIAAVLEEDGFTVEILDLQAEDLTVDEARASISASKPDVVGITAMTSTLQGALEAARLAKEAGAVVVLGGPQMAAYPKETLSYDYVDYGVIGEGEYVMRDLVRAIKAGKKPDMPGVVWKSADGVVGGEGFGLVEDLDALPVPARHLLDMGKYHCAITERKFTTIISSRGCPYNCGFCFKQPCDRFPRYRSPAKVVDEMEECAKMYGTRWFMFYDDTIGVRREHIEGICNEIIKRRLDVVWESPMRVNNVDERLLTLMRRAGCVRLRYGVESADEGILRLMRKGITVSQVRSVFEQTRKAGIETFGYFIIGYAHETVETIRKTIDLAKELDPDWVMFTVATPYPQTHLNDLAVEEGLIGGDYWRLFTLGGQTSRIPYFVKDSDKWVKKAYREFYLRPRFILRKIMRLNSLDMLRRYVDGAVGIVYFDMD
jgi:anaerobic magnesium-protoporphyrin IX monomethyl ester cyclase